jgi:ABC-type sulfate/molybdate transport systems ATPase subunit
MTLLKVSGITKRGDDEPILKDITFTQHKLQKIAIAGETGSGKTTLLKIIAGLILPDEGEVKFQNVKVMGPDERLVPGHPRIAYLSQHFELPKFLRVEQILSYANKMSASRSNELYKVCRIDHLLKRKTDQLSGGEMQRIAMARLLISSPRLLLLDEPFTHLDMVHKSILKSVIRDICEKLKITMILISHDPADTLSWADEIIVLRNGVMIQKGSPENIYTMPINDYVAGLFGDYNSIRKGSKVFSHLKPGKLPENGIIRPENFKIVKKSKNSLPGKVVKVNFFGSHFDIEVRAGKEVFKIRTSSGQYLPGETVYFSVEPERAPGIS